ncbi:MAG: hypothetical protein ACI8TQ_001760 [Planctomycetota bacterium]|jgi:hypothetical protein
MTSLAYSQTPHSKAKNLRTTRSGIPPLSPNTDIAEIERAGTDYAEAYYRVRPEFAERSIHRDLVKLGYKLQADGNYESKPMDYDGFQAMVDDYKVNGVTPFV